MDRWKKDLLRLYCENQAHLAPRLVKLYRRACKTGDWATLRVALRDHQDQERLEGERVKSEWAHFAHLFGVKGEPNV